MVEKESSRIASLLDEAKKKLAPDKRTVVFNVDGTLHNIQLTLKGELHSASLKRQLFDFIKSREKFEIIDSIVVLPQASLGEKTFGVVSVSANIRTKPGHAEEMATQAILGTPLKLLKKHDDWYYVQTPDDYLGWTDDVIAVFDKIEFENWSHQPKVIVTSTYAQAFSSNDKESDIVSDVVVGNVLKLVKDSGKFFEVEYPKGKKGFIAKEDALPYPEWLAGAKETPERIIATAKRFMGVPYLWGGTSAKVMDCSGFTKMVYFLNGVVLPRDASQQALIGEPVSIADNYEHLKMGDLVFFGKKATSERGERVTHVGIYIANFKFIHEGGDVRINSFNPEDADYSEYRTNMLLRAARVIGVGEERGIRRLASIPYYKSNDQ
jgi:SH3-like domain-containing protein